MLATYRRTNQKFAIKTLDKGHLLKHQKLNTVHIERAALMRLSKADSSGHPGIVRLHMTFHDQWSLYFVIDWAKNGELQSLISRLGSLSTECSRYYSAQIIDAVRYMHENGIIHRDLKPENVLLDENYRVKIADFGTAVVSNSDLIPEKFAGTAQYIAPEIIVNNESSKSSDLWSFGCIVYQMIVGRFAFSGLSNYLIMEKVKKVEYEFPAGFDEQAQDLIQKLLVRDPTQRLGAGDDDGNNIVALMAHPFWSSISWPTLWTGPVPPIEHGLVKKEHSLASGEDRNWDDIDATWDDIVAAEDKADDMPWASTTNDRPVAEVPIIKHPGFDQDSLSIEVGPMGEVRPLHVPSIPPPKGRSSRTRPSPSRTPPNTPTPLRSKPMTIPEHTPSPDSSSEGGSPAETNGVIQSMQSLRLNGDEAERGRNQAMTPIQGNGPPVNFGHLLDLPENEKVLYTSTVELSSLRRRASKLFRPLAGPQVKPKVRQLVLTPRRLFVVKYRPKTPDNVTVKAEYVLQSDKEKDSRLITTVEPKGEREFVLMTNASYAAVDADIASTWVRKIGTCLNNTRT
ncbi:kinase-like protein [Hymenopellis radicata]|nr:kinase-like protein [Hymenopellis radicata]